MPKGVPNKRYTPEFKKLVVETMLKEKLSYCETARQFEVSDDKRVAAWERIYLTEGPEGFSIERRGRSSKGRSGTLPKEVEEDFLAEVQRLRAENEYLRQHRTIEVSPKQKTSNHKRSDAFQNLLARQTSIKPPDRVCQLKSSLPKQTYYSFLRFAFAALGIASFESEAAA